MEWTGLDKWRLECAAGLIDAKLRRNCDRFLHICSMDFRPNIFNFALDALCASQITQ